MQTEFCKQLGIEVPIFAFTHCRDVVVAVSKAGGIGAEQAPYDIVGPVCESGDTFAKGRMMPPIKAGDLVVFPNGYKGTWEVKKPLKKRFKHIDGNFVKCALCRFKILSNRLKSIMK